MALWTCAGCSTAYAVGLPACPHCRSTARAEEDTMPKITVHGGASNDAAPTRIEIIAEDGPELISLPDATIVQPSTEEEPSPGNSSETSSPKPEPKQQPSGSGSRSRARKTASPSAKDRTDSSTAPSTDGAPTTDGGA